MQSINGNTVFSVPKFTLQNGTFYATSALGINNNQASTTVGTDAATTSIRNPGIVAQTLSAVIVNSIVYHDDRTISVVIQAKDAYFNVPFKWRPVTVVATPSARLAVLDSRQVRATCQQTAPGQKSIGVCLIKLSLAKEWFSSNAWLVGGKDRRLSLTYGFADSNSASFAALGAVTLHPTLSLAPTETRNNIVAALPAHPVHAGETFDVEVFANFDHKLETFVIDFGVDDSLKIKGFKLAANAVSLWSGTQANTGTIATLSYLRDSSQLSKQGGQDKELLLTMQVQVQGGTGANKFGAVRVSWNDTSNVLDEAIIPDAPSVLIGRHNATKFGSSIVYIEGATPRILFAAAEVATLVNTAILNGQAISSKINTVGVLPNGKFEAIPPADMQCRLSDSKDERTLLASCEEAKITAKQDSSSAQVDVVLTHTRSNARTTLPFAVWVPATPIQLELGDNQLQAVGHWAAGDDCDWQYQRTRVVATATFSTGSGVLDTTFTADVTDIVKDRLYLTATDSIITTETARLAHGVYGEPVVIGKSPGRGKLRVRGGNSKTIGFQAFEVQNHSVQILGLEATVVQRFAVSLELDTSQPFKAATVTVAVNSGPLTYEGQTAQVLTAVKFADGTSTPLTTEDGLHLSSDNRMLAVLHGTDVVVPYMASSGAGHILEINWLPKCRNSNIPLASGHAFANVSLPKAKAATILIETPTTVDAHALFVPPGGPASAAGVATEAKIVVMLEYAERFVDVTSDPRTVFDLSAVKGMFKIDAESGVIRSVRGAARGGKGSVRVSFTHENVTADALIELALVERLLVHATPYPSYPSSNDVRLTTLHVIGGAAPTLYEQAALLVSMTLTNGHVVQIDNQRAAFSVKGNSKEMVAIVQGARIRGIAGGDIRIQAVFAGESAVVNLVISDDPVHVATIDEFVVKQGNRVLSRSRALRGAKGLGKAQAYVSVTLTNKRRFVQLLGNDGVPQVPGLVRFSGDEDDAAVVDAMSGAVTLVNNHWSDVGVTVVVAIAGGSFLEHTTRFPCNLVPAVQGDVDLGASDGQPLVRRAAGDTFEVPLRVNTGGLFLGTFDIYVNFDSSVLSVGDAQKAVRFNPNKKQIQSGILDAVASDDTLHFSGSISADSLKGNDVLLVTITFKALREGTTMIEGEVELMGSTSIPAEDIATRGGAFIAGAVHQIIDTPERHRRDSHWNQLKRKPAAAQMQRRRRAAANNIVESGCVQEYGDTNADCQFNVNDVQFVNQFLAYRGINFAGSDGPTVKAIYDGSVHSRKALDADHNSEVTGKDASFLNKVNLGIFVFVEEVTVTTNGCTTRVQAELYSKGNRIVEPSLADIYFDLALENNQHQTSLNSLAVNRWPPVPTFGSKGRFGVLLAAACTVRGGKSVCGAELEGDIARNLPPFSVGVSVAQIVSQNEGNIAVKFMSGLEKPPFMYTTQLVADVGEAVIKSSGSAGYNPLLSVVVGDECPAASATATPRASSPAPTQSTTKTTPATVATASATPPKPLLTVAPATSSPRAVLDSTKHPTTVAATGGNSVHIINDNNCTFANDCFTVVGPGRVKLAFRIASAGESALIPTTTQACAQLCLSTTACLSFAFAARGIQEENRCELSSGTRAGSFQNVASQDSRFSFHERVKSRRVESPTGTANGTSETPTTTQASYQPTTVETSTSLVECKCAGQNRFYLGKTIIKFLPSSAMDSSMTWAEECQWRCRSTDKCQVWIVELSGEERCMLKHNVPIGSKDSTYETREGYIGGDDYCTRACAPPATVPATRAPLECTNICGLGKAGCAHTDKTAPYQQSARLFSPEMNTYVEYFCDFEGPTSSQKTCEAWEGWGENTRSQWCMQATQSAGPTPTVPPISTTLASTTLARTVPEDTPIATTTDTVAVTPIIINILTVASIETAPATTPQAVTSSKHFTTKLALPADCGESRAETRNCILVYEGRFYYGRTIAKHVPVTKQGWHWEACAARCTQEPECDVWMVELEQTKKCVLKANTKQGESFENRYANATCSCTLVESDNALHYIARQHVCYPMILTASYTSLCAVKAYCS